MKRLCKNGLFYILFSVSAILGMELCLFTGLDSQQARIERVSNESPSGFCDSSGIDIDHDDIRDTVILQSLNLKNLAAVRIVLKPVNYSGNNHSSVWLPPDLA
jgi:hypothetical protein